MPSQLAGFYSVIDSNQVTTTYNDGSSFTGILVQDKVCVTSDPLTCANGIIWYNIKSESGIPSTFDGVAGMSLASDTNV